MDELWSLVNHLWQQAVGVALASRCPNQLSKSAFILESATGHPLAVCGSRSRLYLSLYPHHITLTANGEVVRLPITSVAKPTKLASPFQPSG